MSIQQLTTLSYVFYAMAVFLAAAAAVMFFKFDIRRIWKIMRGKGTSSIIREHSTATSAINAPTTEKLPTQNLSSENLSTQKLPTEKLSPQTLPMQNLITQTLPLQSEETIPLEAIELVLIQDITYTHDNQ